MLARGSHARVRQSTFVGTTKEDENNGPCSAGILAGCPEVVLALSDPPEGETPTGQPAGCRRYIFQARAIPTFVDNTSQVLSLFVRRDNLPTPELPRQRRRKHRERR